MKKLIKPNKNNNDLVEFYATEITPAPPPSGGGTTDYAVKQPSLCSSGGGSGSGNTNKDKSTPTFTEVFACVKADKAKA